MSTQPLAAQLVAPYISCPHRDPPQVDGHIPSRPLRAAAFSDNSRRTTSVQASL
ncbi:hypothetical protein K8O92_28940 [Nocardia asteroides]|nr:hypothetical protein K8O92_28940 [Nocardia asteroides]